MTVKCYLEKFHINVWRILELLSRFLERNTLKTDDSAELKTCSFTKLQFPADLVTFTEEILHGNLHFLCSDIYGFF